jgi:hypothetical protein
MASAIRIRFALALVTLVAAAVTVPSVDAKTQLGRQARPGAVVLDRSGGYYDPQRSIYVPSGKAVDRTGGHYDPERSIYVPGTNQPQ